MSTPSATLTFHDGYESNTQNDGVVLLYPTPPGGHEAPNDMGHTLTHEVGRWVGICPAPQSGYDAPIDYVDDTPAEASPASGCPAEYDTCSNDGLHRKPTSGSSPWNSITYLRSPSAIHNYMEDSDDSCTVDFTRGQITRLKVLTPTTMRSGCKRTYLHDTPSWFKRLTAYSPVTRPNVKLHLEYKRNNPHPLPSFLTS